MDSRTKLLSLQGTGYFTPESLEQAERDSYDQGFDFGLSQGQEEATENYQEYLDNFNRLVTQIHDYESTEVKLKLVEYLATNLITIEDLPETLGDLRL